MNASELIEWKTKKINFDEILKYFQLKNIDMENIDFLRDLLDLLDEKELVYFDSNYNRAKYLNDCFSKLGLHLNIEHKIIEKGTQFRNQMPFYITTYTF